MKNWFLTKRSNVPMLYNADKLLGIDLDELFTGILRDPFEIFRAASKAYPAIDVMEKKNNIVVKADIPGMDKKDINIKLENERLVISGEKSSEKKDENDNYFFEERSYGKFQRNVYLPFRVNEEGIKASYKDGTLTVDIPKAKEEIEKKKNIEITE